MGPKQCPPLQATLHAILIQMLLFGKTGSSTIRDRKAVIQFALFLLLVFCVPSHPFAKTALRKGQKIISHLYLSVNFSQGLLLSFPQRCTSGLQKSRQVKEQVPRLSFLGI